MTPRLSVVRRVVTEAELAAALAVRREVFVRGQGVPAEIETDGHDVLGDDDVAHAVALDAVALDAGAPDAGLPDAGVPGAVDGPRAVGAGRVVVLPGGTARLGRMAVLARGRSTGVGTSLLRLLERCACDRGAVEVVLHAQVPARRFYERAGYRVEGEELVEAGLRHVTMRRSLLPGLRDATDGDAAGVQALIGGCFAEYEGCVLDLADLDDWMRVPGSTSSRHLWVVETAGRLCATVGWHPVDGRTAELVSLYVRAASRGRGLGSHLVRLVERVAREAGHGRMLLWSDSRFLDAHRLYATLGYHRLPETRQLHDPSATTELSFARDL